MSGFKLQVPVGIGADKRLFEKLAGELLLEIPYSLYPDCMFGLLFYKTSVSILTLLSLLSTRHHTLYSRTSMARTPLEP